CWFYILFFFSSRRRHTRFSRDWSSDVCSSDLSVDGGRSGLTAPSPPGGHAGAVGARVSGARWRRRTAALGALVGAAGLVTACVRSEERRVGEECSSGGLRFCE